MKLFISIFFAMFLFFQIASAQPRERWGNRIKNGDGQRSDYHRSHRRGDDARLGSGSESRGKTGFGSEGGAGAGAGAGFEGNVGGGGGVGVGDANANANAKWNVGGGAEVKGNGMGSYGRK